MGLKIFDSGYNEMVITQRQDVVQGTNGKDRIIDLENNQTIVFETNDGKTTTKYYYDEKQNLIKNILIENSFLTTIEIDEELFVEACKKCVQLNARFVPPAGSGASLYLRPILVGTGAQVGVHPAKEYLFMVFACPVGPYFKEGFKPVRFQIARDFDRAAPFGTGKYKVGGNYAASLVAGERAAKEGYSNCIYLNAATHEYIDEVGAANFFGIKNNTYCTPKSSSILPSITNLSLCQIAEDLGMKVERRPIPVEELAEFEEVAACGTAAVISPINEITDRETGKSYKWGEEAGPVCKKLYETLKGIQDGSVEDKHNWNIIVDVD